MQRQTEYAQAIERRCPRELVIAIAREAGGKCNPITLGWMMQTSHRPPMLAISIAPQHYSCEVIRAAGEFVVTFPSEQQAGEAMLYGSRSGRDCDKLALAGAATQPAEAIDCVLLADAVANFECRLISEHETGDHVIFIGEVLRAHVNDQPLKRLYILGPAHRLGGLGE